jgi:hypothetical protein
VNEHDVRVFAWKLVHRQANERADTGWNYRTANNSGVERTTSGDVVTYLVIGIESDGFNGEPRTIAADVSPSAGDDAVGASESSRSESERLFDTQDISDEGPIFPEIVGVTGSLPYDSQDGSGCPSEALDTQA